MPNHRSELLRAFAALVRTIEERPTIDVIRERIRQREADLYGTPKTEPPPKPTPPPTPPPPPRRRKEGWEEKIVTAAQLYGASSFSMSAAHVRDMENIAFFGPKLRKVKMYDRYGREM